VESFVLNFLASFFVLRQRMKWGLGAKPLSNSSSPHESIINVRPCYENTKTSEEIGNVIENFADSRQILFPDKISEQLHFLK
jgi:hypothetical protein